MAYKGVFARYESKYIVTDVIYRELMQQLGDRIVPDEYGPSVIGSIYLDTDDYRLIRASVDKPVYKEKLRLRAYGIPTDSDTVFLEMKKKYKGIVYKRRIFLSAERARSYLGGDRSAAEDSQIKRELDWFMSYYGRLSPKVYIASDREAFVGADNPELRITADSKLRWRTDRLDLTEGDDGSPLTAPGERVIEIKTSGAFPLWLCGILDGLEIRPSSFSKYGACYAGHILPDTGKNNDNGVIICA